MLLDAIHVTSKTLRRCSC